ncbi:TonB family C-terminal domain-containing protein [Rhodoblastus acidophilus]|uniref:TonB family C-terminal domain-containing protein n=3 Tax=Rhodoblastus acidophilus TaxID=1074 RepID=A0A212S728_RHOAC|nr:energy transducer TonB [Rhodoblastus acidophilus]SNB80969.1 TonB family C-terminal domain-containing protein [Rhodoblastus acidophilus]
MILSSTFAAPFLQDTAPERPEARAWRRLAWSSLASLALHLTLAIAVFARAPADDSAQDFAGGERTLDIAYLSADDLNSLDSEAAPAPVEAPPQPAIDSAPVAAVSPSGEEAPPPVGKSVSPARPKPVPSPRAVKNVPKPTRPTQPRRAVEKEPAPLAQAGRGSERQNARAGSQGGARGPAPASGGAEAQNWRGAVLAQLARHKQYPSVARDRDVTGIAVVAFTLSASGQVQGVALARGSGSSALDQATLVMVRNAAPFPPAPAGARLSFTTAVNYSLR